MGVRQQIKTHIGLSLAQQVALGLTPVYSQYYPQAGAYTLADVAPGFTEEQGWMLCRWVCTTLPAGTASMYPFTIHGGSSADIMGFRINGGDSVDNVVEDYWRKDSSNYGGVMQGEFPTYANEIKTAIISWDSDGTKYIIIDDTYDEDSDPLSTFEDGDMTTLQVGARNGGSDALTGTVIYAEVGNQYLTPEQASARMAMIRKPLVVATAGQSNIQNWDDGVETTDPEGRRGFVETVHDYTAANCPGEVVFVGAAEGGSSIFEEVNGSEYWVDSEGNPGNEMLEFFASVDRTGHHPDVIFWDEGESESHYIDDTGGSYPWLTSAVYKTRLKLVFDLMRARYPYAQILIGKLGIRDSFSNTGGIQAIVNIQNELIEENSWIHHGYERYDKTLYSDGVHYTDASYLALGQRGGNRVLALSGYAVTGTRGPKVASASRSGTALTITLDHDGGTDFTPATGIEGFYYEDSGGNQIPLSSEARASANTITATLASAVAGRLYYMHDNDSVNLANTVKDNHANAMPLLRGYVDVA